MSKPKDDSLDPDGSADLYEDDEVIVTVTEVGIDDSEDQLEMECLNAKANKKLITKRRLDDYLERKWFKENGWDDDDDLFQDEYFTEETHLEHKRL